MKIIVHVGPHRTGTTSIQALLAESRDDLLRSRIWYPKCQYVATAHHVLAWQVLGRDLRAIGAADESRSATSILASWIDEARMRSCNTMVLSSEDFSIFRDKEWWKLRSFVGPAVTWHFVAARRDPTEAARSAYSHLLLSGLSQEFDEVKDILRKGTAEFFEYVELLARMQSWCSIHLVGYSDTPKYLASMIRTLVGSSVTSKVLPRSESPSLNARLDADVCDYLLAFNRLNTPGFVLDPLTGALPADFYGRVDGERPKIAWVAGLVESVMKSEMQHRDAS